MEKQANVQAFRALRDQRVSDDTHNERRIEALETQLGFERSNRVEAQDTARQHQERLNKPRDEEASLDSNIARASDGTSQEGITNYENLLFSYHELKHIKKLSLCRINLFCFNDSVRNAHGEGDEDCKSSVRGPAQNADEDQE